MFGDDLQGYLQCGHVHLPVLHIAQRLLQVITLNVYNHHICKLQGVVSERGRKRLFLINAASDPRLVQETILDSAREFSSSCECWAAAFQ